MNLHYFSCTDLSCKIPDRGQPVWCLLLIEMVLWSYPIFFSSALQPWTSTLLYISVLDFSRCQDRCLSMQYLKRWVPYSRTCFKRCKIWLSLRISLLLDYPFLLKPELWKASLIASAAEEGRNQGYVKYELLLKSRLSPLNGSSLLPIACPQL